jgi:DNA-binding LacI/PurR family transcriptional regulator
MQDIANRCGVSRATVGRALSPQPLEVDPATVEHIRAVAVEMGYRHARGSFDKTIPPSPSPVVTFSVTQKDIAKRCGVSYTTVQRVLQHNGRSVRPEIAERIRTVIAEMGYDPETNHFARKMRSRGHRLPVLNHAVALLNRLGSLLELYGYHVERGIADVLNKAGFDLIIGWNQQRPPWQFPRPLLRGDVDGVLFTAAADSFPTFSASSTRFRALAIVPWWSI